MFPLNYVTQRSLEREIFWEARKFFPKAIRVGNKMLSEIIKENERKKEIPPPLYQELKSQGYTSKRQDLQN